MFPSIRGMGPYNFPAGWTGSFGHEAAVVPCAREAPPSPQLTRWLCADAAFSSCSGWGVLGDLTPEACAPPAPLPGRSAQGLPGWPSCVWTGLMVPQGTAQASPLHFLGLPQPPSSWAPCIGISLSSSHQAFDPLRPFYPSWQRAVFLDLGAASLTPPAGSGIALDSLSPGLSLNTLWYVSPAFSRATTAWTKNRPHHHAP